MHFAQWLEIYRLDNLILALVVGLIIGLLIGLVFRRPRTWVAFGTLILLAVLSPYIGVSTFVIRNSCSPAGVVDTYNGSGINFPPFLLAITLTCALCFLARKLYQRYRLSLEPKQA